LDFGERKKRIVVPIGSCPEATKVPQMGVRIFSENFLTPVEELFVIQKN